MRLQQVIKLCKFQQWSRGDPRWSHRSAQHIKHVKPGCKHNTRGGIHFWKVTSHTLRFICCPGVLNQKCSQHCHKELWLWYHQVCTPSTKMSGGRAQKSTFWYCFHLKEEGNELLESLVTGEGTWVNCFTPQMTQAERQGKHTISPTVKKFSVSVCLLEELEHLWSGLHKEPSTWNTTTNANAHCNMLWPLCEAIHREPGHVTRCDPSAQQCNPTQCIPDPREVADVSMTTSGPLSDNWEVTSSTVMRTCTWLFMNGTECRRPIHTATEFVNLCQGWPNASMCSGIILKTHNNSADYISYSLSITHQQMH